MNNLLIKLVAFSCFLLLGSCITANPVFQGRHKSIFNGTYQTKFERYKKGYAKIEMDKYTLLPLVPVPHINKKGEKLPYKLGVPNILMTQGLDTFKGKKVNFYAIAREGESIKFSQDIFMNLLELEMENKKSTSTSQPRFIVSTWYDTSTDNEKSFGLLIEEVPKRKLKLKDGDIDHDYLLKSSLREIKNLGQRTSQPIAWQCHLLVISKFRPASRLLTPTFYCSIIRVCPLIRKSLLFRMITPLWMHEDEERAEIDCWA